MLELKGSPSWIRTTLHGLTVRRLHLDCSWGMFLLIITLATPKGFEPLTFGFGDQRSAGLNYGAIIWWRISDSNRSPPACKAGALPDELIPRVSNTLFRMCVSKHTNKVSSVVCLEGKCALILWNFTNCVVATVFSSSRPPTL